MNTCTRCGATSSLPRCPFCGSAEMTLARSTSPGGAAPATPASPTAFDDIYRAAPAVAPAAPRPGAAHEPTSQQSAADQQRAAWAAQPGYGGAVPPHPGQRAPHPTGPPLPGAAPTAHGAPQPSAASAAPPPPAAGTRPVGLIIGICAAAVAALVALALAFGVFNKPQQAVAPPAQPPTTPSATSAGPTSAPTSAAPSTTPSSAPPASTPTSAPATSAPSVITDPAQAQAKLSELADAGRGEVSFDGRWVAQLASKYDGVTDPQLTAMNGGHTFRFPDILNEYQMLQRSAPADTQVVLLRSTDYGKRTVVNGQPLWVTMAVRPDFTSEAAVQSWCAQRYPAVTGKQLKNICMPNRLAP